MHLPINRRTVLKLTTALGAIGVGSLADRAQAMEAFSAGCEDAIGQLPDDVFANPARFAAQVDSCVANIPIADYRNSPFATIAKPAHGEMEATREAFLHLHPEYRDRFSAFSEFEDACFNYAIAAYSEGVRYGAMYESLRRDLAGAVERGN